MHGGMFAEDIMITDAEPRGFVLVFEVLRGVTNDTTGMETVMSASRKDAGEIDMRADDAMRPKLHLGVNDGVRADADSGVEFGRRMNDGR